MKRIERGGALIKYLMLICLVAVFVAFLMWKNDLGATGQITPLPGTTADRIIFVTQNAKGETNLALVNSDGTGLSQLTDDTKPKRMPSWSPDGKQLCFSMESKDGGATTYQLYILGGDGTPKPLTYGSTAKDAPQWRPDGKLIAFMVGGVVKVVQPNGNALDQIYPPPHKGASSDQDSQDVSDSFKVPPINIFRWAPKGSSLAGVQVAEGEVAQAAGATGWWQHTKNNEDAANVQRLAEPESVIVLQALEPKPFMLMDSDASIVGISWFPDATRLAVSMRTGRGAHILRVYRADVKGMTPDQVLIAEATTVAPQNPAVSPDGKSIAAEIWRVTSPADSELLGIAVMSTDVNRQLIIRNAGDIAKIPFIIKGRATNPQWSPDGTRLLYSQPNKTGTRDLWVAQADGSKPVNLTKGSGDSFDAAWSPVLK